MRGRRGKIPRCSTSCHQPEGRAWMETPGIPPAGAGVGILEDDTGDV